MLLFTAFYSHLDIHVIYSAYFVCKTKNCFLIALFCFCRLFQVAWRTRTGFIYDRHSLKKVCAYLPFCLLFPSTIESSLANHVLKQIALYPQLAFFLYEIHFSFVTLYALSLSANFSLCTYGVSIFLDTYDY